MNRIAILIPVFNHIELTRICIKQLLPLVHSKKIQNASYTIVVIDDGSTDGTGAWLRQHHPEIQLLSGDGNLWWSGGVNLGAKFAMDELNTDFVLLWNNDIITADDYFTELDTLLDQPDNRTIIGSKIYYQGQDQVIWSFGGIFNPRNGVKYMIGYNQPDSKEFDQVREVDWLPGMGTLIPVQVIRDIGFWDADHFPQYHGDSDFTYRARLAGYRIRVYPRLILYNDKSSSGLTHGGTVGGLIRSFSSIRSNTNIRKNLLFYRRYATSILAYRVLAGFYFRMVGGFIKWKVLALAGIKREHNPGRPVKG